MRKSLLLALASATTLALAGCGSSDKANEQASPDNVEMPAEESMSSVAAEPVPDTPPAPATAPADPNAAAKPDDAASAAAAAAADFNAAGDGEDQAVQQAEKKM